MTQLILPGNAGPGDVRAGKYFCAGTNYNAQGIAPDQSNAGVILTPGPNDIAIPAGIFGGTTADGKVSAVTFDTSKVLTGTTIAGTGGTMPENGPLNYSLPINGSFTIPSGHTSGGTVNQNVPTKSAQTYTPSASTQTIASGQYLTGAQTISAVTFDPSKVLSDTTIAGTRGTMPENGTLSITPSGTGAIALPSGHINGGTVAQVSVPADKVLSGTSIAGVAGAIPNFASGSQMVVNYWADGAGNAHWSIPLGGYVTQGPGPTGSTEVFGYDPNFIASNILDTASVLGLQGTAIPRKFASGTAYATNGVITVSGLTFQPTSIIAIVNGYYGLCYDAIDQPNACIGFDTTNNKTYASSVNTGGSNYVNSTGFQLTGVTTMTNTNVPWIAFA